MTLKDIQDFIQLFADWAVPMLIVFIPLYGLIKGVKVYEAFVEGAREGFDVAVRIMPYLVAILVAIGLFRDVTAMDVFSKLLGPITNYIGMPPEILPMAIIRPLSGSGASGMMNSIMLTYGPDSYIGLMASVLMGSTETTFYIIAVYFGSVNLKKTRHALPAGLIGDLAGIAGTIILCRMAFSDLIGK